ncbi:MAG: hypothetical protein ACD_9C00188G0003 [uncultured bacterium]|nr:MAG: hypothetical protein ACD_9C00188G0003 [uncultured bacterium]
MPKKRNENGPGWAGIAQGIIGKSISRIEEDITERAKEVIIKIERKTAGALLLFVGAIFFLVALALLINSFLSPVTAWVGWGVVGLVIIIVAYLIGRSD